MTVTEVGTGKYVYSLSDDWAKLPAGMRFGRVSDVGIDSQDRVYVFQRTDPPVLVFDREGTYLNSWGNGAFLYPHGLHIANDIVYLTDRDSSVCIMYTLDGKPIQMLGKHKVTSDTGAAGFPAPVPRVAGPFNQATDIVPAPWGDLYVTDGHRNARVHRFDSGGHLLQSWGTWGKTEPGQFDVPHSLIVGRDGRVYVVDKENYRIQVFSANGEFQAMWTDMRRPNDIALTPEGDFAVCEGVVEGYTPRISIFDKEGNVLARWETVASEGLGVDSRGDIYLSRIGHHNKGIEGVDKYVRQR
jgi:hypothetical protein